MTTPALPATGTIGLTPISGDVGKLIEFGDFLNGQGFRDWEHAFLLGPDGSILEAEPGGARIGNVSEYSDIYWCTAIASQFTEGKLADIWGLAVQKYGPEARWKTRTGGVGYSFLDYLALFCHRLRIPVPGLRGYIGSTKHMICSVLADQAYADEGCHLFAGTWPGYVTPLGLFNLDIAIRVEEHAQGVIPTMGWRSARGPRKVRM